ncbi:MAG: SUMF1/EgtB/PvdO family nonheme iron enzyme, partial [Anaerolineales bacterium]|nr:SUMF1/EgtB/PvdO family nonheme iron enzyme [Anaerolineales bacterium]
SAGGNTIITGSGNIVRDFDVAINKSRVVFASDLYWQSQENRRPDANLLEATKTYFEYLVDRYRYLDIRGMGVSDRISLRLSLLNLYVPLRARPELSAQEKRGQMLAEEMLESERRTTDAQPVIELLKEHSGLIVLGDPGSGKTTFLKAVALRLALGEGKAIGVENRLPILLPISAYANALQQADVRLDTFISEYYHKIGASLPVGSLLQHALDEGSALIFLDGLDEIGDLNLRSTTLDRIAHFYAFYRKKGNKFVITSRIIGYRQVRRVLDDLIECVLDDFSDDDIQAFLSNWTIEVEKQSLGDSEVSAANAERERSELYRAIKSSPGIRRLAGNPLLLTILALVKRQGVTLPERRVELYNLSLRALLSTWNRARSLSGRVAGSDVDEVQTIRLLALLAFWMHQTKPGIGLIERSEIENKLEELFKERGEPEPRQAVQQFLEDIERYTGVLIARGVNEYGFIHLTYEEYLAAISVCLDSQGDPAKFLDLFRPYLADPAWQEIFLLAIGHLGIIQMLDRAAGQVVETLAAQQPGEPGQAVVLAGQAVLDAWPGGVPASSKDKITQTLVNVMQKARVAPELRRRAGLVLGRLGWVPDDLNDFVKIKAGEFLYGEKPGPQTIHDDYWIAKYPVTNLQYASFIAAGGYHELRYWSTSGWKWLQDQGYNNPRYWDNLDWSNPIFPVVGVSWYEALAYCRWLNTQALGFEKPSNYQVQLPTQQQWERGARGVDGWEYPWGEEFSKQKANTSESNLRATTAVCTYPQGVSLDGVWDTSGNVWEWTLGGEQEIYRVVRGGSWYFNGRITRCAYLGRPTPDGFNNSIGFRVVVSLASDVCR